MGGRPAGTLLLLLLLSALLLLLQGSLLGGCHRDRHLGGGGRGHRGATLARTGGGPAHPCLGPTGCLLLLLLKTLQLLLLQLLLLQQEGDKTLGRAD